MTKNSNFFHDCLLVMLRDFEICPFIATLKDCFILYILVSGVQDANVVNGKSFTSAMLAQILQIFADYFLPQ
jgi:hypothetical protein